MSEPEPRAPPSDPPEELRLTPGQWHTLLEKRSFLERADNRFLPPRRFLGRPVRIVPDESWR